MMRRDSSVGITDVPISSFKAGSHRMARIGHRALRENLSPVLAEVEKLGGAVEITNGSRREAVVVTYDVFLNLVSAAQEVETLKSTMAPLVAAVSHGVAVPSTTLDSLGLNLSSDPELVKAFRTRHPVQFTHGDDGTRLPSPGRLRVTALREVDDEDDIVFIDDDV
jgi:prevent-host-death family protein